MTSLTLTGLANVTGTQTATGGLGGGIAASFPGNGGAGGLAMGGGSATSTGFSTVAETGNAVGGNGGIGRGGGFAGGIGGAAGMNPISVFSAGGNVTATANATGGNGGIGNDNANGGAGGIASLIDDVAGTTSGNVTLNESTIGGNGGTSTGAGGGAAGTANSTLNFSRASGGTTTSNTQCHGRQRRRREWRRCGSRWWSCHDESGADGRGRCDRNANSIGRQRRRDYRQLARQWRSRRRSDRGRIDHLVGPQHGVDHGYFHGR